MDHSEHSRSPFLPLRKYRFLRGSLPSILAWPIGCGLLVAVLWAVAFGKLHQENRIAEVNGRHEAAQLAEGFAEHIFRTVAQIDHTLLSVKFLWEDTGGAYDLSRQLGRGLFSGSTQFRISMIDRNGRIVATTITPSKAVDLTDRDYFVALSSGKAQGLYISRPTVGRVSGDQVIHFARRLDEQDGAFAGVVLISFQPSRFVPSVSKTMLRQDNFVALKSADLVMSAAGGSDGAGAVDGFLHDFVTNVTSRGVVRVPGERFADGVPRLVAWQGLRDYPFVALAGITEDGIYAPYRAMARDYRHAAAIVTALLLLMAATGMVFSIRLAWRKFEAQKTLALYGISRQADNEGFFLMERIEGGKPPLDFEILDCNDWGAAFYGLDRNELIGKRLSDFYSGALLEQVLEFYRMGTENGGHEDEYRVPPDSPLPMEWLYRKAVPTRLGLTVLLRDISEAKRHELALSRMANSDALTALPNRQWLMRYLPKAIEAAERNGVGLALMFVDLDDFKNVNDTLGHAAGDELLRLVAGRLQAVIRPEDHVVRLGGDEFTILLERIASNDTVSAVAGRIIQVLSDACTLSVGKTHLVRGSVGISLYPRDGNDADTLLKHADIAMYAAKANGKANHQYFQPQMSQRLVERLGSEQALRTAIERDEFVLYYQPRVDTRTGELRSMEALVRWQHPERGIVSPLEFIPLAEETGLIVRLGELIFEKACRQLADWKAENLPVVPVSVNVSPRQFDQGSLVLIVTSSMVEHGIDASLIEIELTESSMLGNNQTVFNELKSIEELGITLLIDDFGSGYSSLSQLQRLDMDVLKVDRTFTSELDVGRDGDAFFMAIVSMAHVLDMRVVAEGVETIEQLRILQQLSCDEVQGYYVSRPVPVAEVPALLHRRFLFP
ncbi:MAG: bifunctional diguanylate cyclase/phosphodiesterase, partial [Burkholderiaceae bacterium]